MTDVTVILNAIENGTRGAADLLPLVYAELRQLAAGKMRQEQPGMTLQATALVHEAFLRLLGDQQTTWHNRRHFFGAAAIAMERILVEQARRRHRIRHGGQLVRADLDAVDVVSADAPPDEQLLDIADALAEFEQQQPQKAELVRLRYFTGLSEQEAAKTLDISRATAARWWAFARAWIFEKLDSEKDKKNEAAE